MYEKLVFPFPEESCEIVAEGDDPEYVVKPQAYFRGACQIPGSEYNVGFQIFVKPFFLDRTPHIHMSDEYLIFTGGTFPNLFDWDADIELTLGEIGVDAEVYHITKPTIIRIPKGVYHCPLNFKRIDKPVFFQAALMQGVFGGTYLDPGQRPRELWYNGDIACRYDASKRCNVCKKCLQEDWKQA